MQVHGPRITLSLTITYLIPVVSKLSKNVKCCLAVIKIESLKSILTIYKFFVS